MQIITGPVAAIGVALIVTFGALLGTGGLRPQADTYATVSFENGYKKLGVINEERVFTQAVVKMNGKRIKSGDFKDIVEWMTEQASTTGGLDKTNWKPGVEITARAGVEWTGSESKFQLTTDSLTMTSTEEKNLPNAEVIAALKSLEKKAKNERKKNSKEALKFGPAPAESSLMKKILSALDK